MRDNLTTFILFLSLLVGETHSTPFFSDIKTENWIIRKYKPVTQQWNMQMVESKIMVSIYFLSFLVYRPTKINDTTIITFIYGGLLDTAWYFWNFNDPLFYGSYYVYLMLIWLLVYYWNEGVKQAIEKRTKRIINSLLPKRWRK